MVEPFLGTNLPGHAPVVWLSRYLVLWTECFSTSRGSSTVGETRPHGVRFWNSLREGCKSLDLSFCMKMVWRFLALMSTWCMRRTKLLSISGRRRNTMVFSVRLCTQKALVIHKPLIWMPCYTTFSGQPKGGWREKKVNLRSENSRNFLCLRLKRSSKVVCRVN